MCEGGGDCMKHVCMESAIKSDISVLQTVYVALHQKPGGEDVFQEYSKTKSLSDQTRRKLVNILVADMVETHG